MYVYHLDTGQFWQADGTVQREWTNPWPNPVTIQRVSLWGGLSIGAIMDFAAALYVTGPGNYLERDNGSVEVNLMPLAYMALDRYGPSNGQNYQIDKDWEQYGVLVHPGQKLILQANCVQHNPSTNPVIGGPGSGDNAHAQAYIWMI